VLETPPKAVFGRQLVLERELLVFQHELPAKKVTGQVR
jgi:hypothetical protein